MGLPPWVGLPRHQFRSGGGDAPGKADRPEQANGKPGHVQFPPCVAMTGRAWIGMVVIVPPFTVADVADK